MTIGFIEPNPNFLLLKHLSSDQSGRTGVDLRSFYVGMAQHTGYRLDRHSLAQRQSGKGVAGHVKGDVLLDATRGCYLLQILVHLLVRHRWEKLILALRIILVLLDDAFGAVKKDHADRSGGLLTRHLYPLDTIKRDNIICLELLDINIRQAGETREYEQITDETQTIDLEVFLNDGLELLLGEEASVNRLQM